jgi:hypothetical protein
MPLHWCKFVLLPAVPLFVACTTPSDHSGSPGGGGGGGGGGSTLEPATYNASVNSTLPPGYSIYGIQPYQWQAYVYINGWVPADGPKYSMGPSAVLNVDCNGPVMTDACTSHLPGMIQVAVITVLPGPTRLCAYKSGFRLADGLLLNTPLGNLAVAPVASSSQDPANAGVCYP